MADQVMMAQFAGLAPTQKLEDFPLFSVFNPLQTLLLSFSAH
jgi:hypothetical protein